MIRSITPRLTVTALLICVLAGCQAESRSVVKGSVLMNGKPLQGARVRFVPKADPNLGTAMATTDSEGAFTIQPDAQRNNLLRPGAFLVLIDKEVSDPAGAMGTPVVNQVPARFSQQSLTPLKVELTQGENTLPPFEVGDAKQ